jgi:long-chain acyl-CoA synthetase
MPNFLETILAQLKRADGRVVLREVHGDHFVSVTGRELLDRIQLVRAFLRGTGVHLGDRCALLAPNSIRWAAFHLALMAEGVIVVPLYSRQSPVELAGMMKDCQPRLIFVGDPALGDGVVQAWPGAPPRVLFDEVLRSSSPQPPLSDAPNPRHDSDIVTIIYTSGTSGEPKGVCLNVGNLTHMLSCTTERLDQLMGATHEPDRVFHYLPFNFAASTILMLSCLTRESVLTLSTDLNKLADEIRLASPNYFLNVPTLLERVRRGVEDAIAKRRAIIRSLFTRARTAWERQHVGRGRALDSLWLALGRALIFRKIRERFGLHLRALICGSAPLAPETQQFFLMLGISVLQAYGLTETTGICTLDDPRVPVEPGYVGSVISGTEMKLAENEEIVVRGPHIFPGYWNRPEETNHVLQDGWFHTGDQGEVNVRGNWRISGRIKNLIILNSGHNIAPEPIEEKIAGLLPAAQQVVIVGNGRGYLCALVTGAVESAAVQAALDAVNAELPHYRQIRNFTLIADVFSPENGLLTANGKLRRDAINARCASEINAMYDSKAAREAVSRQHA